VPGDGEREASGVADQVGLTLSERWRPCPPSREVLRHGVDRAVDVRFASIDRIRFAGPSRELERP
jgi:hypothetical protein